MNNSFSENDKTAVVKFLNHIAKHATFEHNIEQTIEFYKLLNFMQTQLIPKINDNILEITKVVEKKRRTK